MNLLDDPWLPVRRQSGERTLIVPWQLTDQIDTDPIVALDTPRADFNGSLVQFLVGFVQTVFAPENESQWGKLYEKPPEPEQIKAAGQAYREAFELDGDGPRFLQDYDILKDDIKGIGGLLIEEPGGNTLKENRDLFIKRGQYDHLGLPATIAALITLQTNAPSGGVGHRTSMRGGGPLTTLLVPDPLRDPLPVNLWRLVWLNVLSQTELSAMSGDPTQDKPADIFPWLAPTRTSEAKTGVETTPMDIHPYQVYWGMPRRIRLELDELEKDECPLTREPSPLVSGYRTRNYGVNYTGPWKHPLSPYSRNKDGDYLPLHPQPGGIGYRHWLGLVLGEQDKVEPAQVVTNSHASRARRRRHTRLWAFGYDMDNMKARAWYESLMPLYHIEETIRDAFVDDVKGMILAASEIASNLRGQLKKAWFKPKHKVSGDLSFVVEAFWHHTEPDFYNHLEQLRERLEKGESVQDLREAWFRILREQSVALFDQWTATGALEDEDPKRIAVARNELHKFNYKKAITDALRISNKKAA
ncbi:type I-E CRISPR-associated protein Cse1/CasA [Magnetovirga frankeli]|uniref:type I-E CRISPR-associated protein Cse1/CasA n=1 Tax=Magnetovirga frankeli TaxID=947516 RepID=UPI00129364AC|nr:type I-E CRISPR-associated protein Cse1/CasA [gamma proteobacterium SS-5]